MNIPKDQMEQLTLEQREALALSEFQRGDKRKRLLKQAAGGYLGFSLAPIVVLFSATLAPWFITNSRFAPLVSAFVSMTLWILIEYHAVRVNRRLDALLELIKEKHDS